MYPCLRVNSRIYNWAQQLNSFTYFTFLSHKKKACGLSSEISEAKLSDQRDNSAAFHVAVSSKPYILMTDDRPEERTRVLSAEDRPPLEGMIRLSGSASR